MADVRAGFRYDNYDVGDGKVALVLHDDPDPVTLAGPSQPVALPIAQQPPSAMPASFINLWLAEQLAIPSSSIVLVLDDKLPVPRQLNDQQWEGLRAEWDAQLSQGLTRGFAHLAANPPSPVDPPQPSVPIRSSLYQPHPSFSEPADLDGGLWRYLSVGKLIDLISRRELWFSRLDLLGDPLEGSLGSPNAERRRLGLPIPSDQLEAIAHHVRHNSYACCWHLSAHESAAMWNLYAQGGEAVAIRSSFRRLVEAIQGPERFYSGQVRYADYSSTFVSETNSLDRIMHKRASYEHEREVRVVLARFDPMAETPRGVRVPVDLDTLIERIHVAPTAPQWFLDVVVKLGNLLSASAPVVRSDMDSDPVW